MAVIKNNLGTNSLEVEADGSINVNLTGGATEAGQTTTNNLLTTIDADTGAISTSVASVDTKTPALVGGRVPVDPSGVTSPVSVSSLPLPTGASTAANQTTGNNSLSSIDTKLPALDSGYVPVNVKNTVPVSGTFWQATQPVSFTRLASGTDSVTVVPSGTQTVSGTVTANIGTTNGVALDATLTGGTQRTKITDGTNNNSLVQLGTQVTTSNYGLVTNAVIHGLSGGSYVDVKVTPSGALAVDATISGTVPVSFTRLDSATDSVTTVPSGTQVVSGTVTANAGTGTFAVSAASLPLPTDAATSALQTSGNASLTSIDAKSTKGALSSTNNSTTPLNAGATFTGTAEQNAYPDVYVSCITDQTGTLYFDFSNDGTNWNVFPPSGFTLVAGVHEAHKALKAGRYFRVRVTNTSGSNQTYLRLYTYFGEFDQLTAPLTFVPSVDSDATTTKSVLVGQTDGGVFKFVGVDPEGALHIHVTDSTSPFGELITAELTPLIQADFVYGINTNLFSSTLTGSGTATSTNQMGIASTTANTSSSSLIQTVRRAKYRAGEGLLSRFTAQFTTGVANSTQTAGMRNVDIDGWFIGYNGTSFGIMYRRNSVDTWVTQSNFNLDKLDGTGSSGITIDPTKINIFQLGIGYLGVRGCTFSIQHPDTKNWITFHDYSFMNSTADQSQSVNPTMTFGIQATNTTNATNIAVKASSVGVFIIGKRERIGSTYGVNNFKSVATTETNILTVRNNTTINGITNQSQIRIRSLSVATAAAVPVVFKLTKNPTVGGTPSFTNVDATNSCAAFDVAGTTITGGNVQFNTIVGANGNVFVDLTEFDIFLAPNDRLVCTAASISGAAANQVVAINWNEDI